MRWRWGGMRGYGHEIDPEDIFLDSSNIAQLDTQQLEGRIERPVPRGAIQFVGAIFVLAALVFGAQAFNLQIIKGAAYADIARNNRLERDVLFASRGIVYDRNGIELAWNAHLSDASTTLPYAEREYIHQPGFAHLLGFVRYPKADADGLWWREEYTGVSGIEHALDSALAGKNGSIMTETDARGGLVRKDIVDPPKSGESLTLSIDAEIQAELARVLSEHAAANGFQGGVGMIMDVRTGGLLAMTSFPEYDNVAFARGDTAVIAEANTDPRTPLINRAIAGVYTPGSIVKPIFAAAGLEEGLITLNTRITSSGSIQIPNPYFPDKPSIFRDWKAHGEMDVRHALAVSSNVFFYEVGGGYGSQKGLGIRKIDAYARMFGFGSTTGFALEGEEEGTIPTPEWKEQIFNDPWRLGDTYHTAIGQYGFQVTPIQVVRFIAAIANGGTLLTPQLVHGAESQRADIGISKESMDIVRDGLRMAVHSQYADRTERVLDIEGIVIAGKTGTAQIGARNEFMNSWAIGFWPYEDPKYAFAVVLERAPAGTLSGAAPGVSKFFYWLRDTHPEYVR